jgi:hypothetical protein
VPVVVEVEVKGESAMARDVALLHFLSLPLPLCDLAVSSAMAVSTATNGTANGAICLISTLPEYVDQEKHKEILASTPADFSTLPSVLIYLAKDVTISFVPKLEGFSTDSSTKGSLYVIDRCVCYI